MDNSRVEAEAYTLTLGQRSEDKDWRVQEDLLLDQEVRTNQQRHGKAIGFLKSVCVCV
jgi:hypothetical protein